jgi:hypothetical protein
MIDEIGNELEVVWMNQQFQVRVDRIVAQITFDELSPGRVCHI